MTEVPEHLLARSKAARAKASGGDAGGTPPATPGEQPGQTAEPSAAIEPAAAAAAPAPIEEPAKPVPPFVAAAQARPRIPRFAIPVLASLPVWALIYAGTLVVSGPADAELALGQQVYASQCAGCHGGGGEGGTGRPLGEVLLTFPDRQQHVDWVVNGSPEEGTPYGDPDREGGQRISQEGPWTAMPGFGESLSEEEIAAVVRYEREHFGGEAPTPSDGSAEGGATASAEDGETEPDAGQGQGSGTNEAEAQGGDVGGDNPESGGSDAAPAGNENEGGVGETSPGD